MASKSPSARAREPKPKLAGPRQKTGVSRYYQLYALLSNALNDGTIAPGSALPSEPELASRHRLSRKTTVRRALERLEHESRIVRLRGSGTFARQAPLARKLCLNLHTFYEDLPTIASKTSVSVLKFEPEDVPAGARDVQSQLGERPFVIQRLHKHQGTPYQLSTAYIPESVGRQMRRSSLGGSTSIITALDKIGPKTVSAEHTMSAAVPPTTSHREHFASHWERHSCECAPYSATRKAVSGQFTKACHDPIISMCVRSLNAIQLAMQTARGGCGPSRQAPLNADIV